MEIVPALRRRRDRGGRRRQNQIWAALWWNYTRPGLFINSGGAGTMGFAFPAAIGAKFARPEKAVWCVAGEGGFGHDRAGSSRSP